jgi:hypothetical protein
VELSNWYWFYDEQASQTLPYMTSDPTTPDSLFKKKPKPKDTTKTSNRLLLNMRALNIHGASFDDLELSEAQFSSIRFIWKDKGNDLYNILDKVLISIADGRTVELLQLEPAFPYRELHLMGDTNIKGFSAKFSEYLGGTTTPRGLDSVALVEIRVQ